MPHLNGLDAARQRKQSTLSVKPTVMAMNEDPYLMGEAFRAGASAYLLKQAAGLELIEAVERVLKGDTYLTQNAAKGLDDVSLL
jgi:DNA-binding NarL/FixJ family response regulator